jgi:hypothetical protein
MSTPTYITMAEYAAMRRTTVASLYVQYCKRRTPNLAPRYKLGSRVLIKLDEAIASIEAGKIIS